jgi:uncharacterized small protein (DUF1192 family)
MSDELDELAQSKRPAKPRDLSTLSIEELNAYVGRLEAEIGRVREVIKAKSSHRTSADALFRKS